MKGSAKQSTDPPSKVQPGVGSNANSGANNNAGIQGKQGTLGENGHSNSGPAQNKSVTNQTTKNPASLTNNAATKGDESLYNDLNASGQHLLGGFGAESALMQSPNASGGGFKGIGLKNMANAATVRGSHNGGNKPQQYAPIANSLTAKGGNLNQVVPGGSKATLDLNEIDRYYNLENDTTPERGRNNQNASSLSLRSSFDYMDLNLNEGMHLRRPGSNTHRNLPSKSFKEDATPAGNLSGDESVYEKKMKMPNLNALKADYQREIGINLDLSAYEETQQHHTPEELDSLDEIRDMMPAPQFYKIVRKDRIQVIDDYHDRCPLLGLRKQIMKARVYTNRGAQLIMMQSLFETISISVIVINSLFLAMDDPLRLPEETPQFMNVADDIFQYLYTIEMVVKIVSLGFICNQGSYLRDAWNILDFVIIASGYMSMFLAGSGVNLSALRSFRVIRPLRTISSVAGLRVIVSSLINAIPLLRDSILVLFFFFLVFAIAGTQLFTGAFKNRCYFEDTGLIDPRVPICGGQESCLPQTYCGKSNENPANGASNFDNVMFSMLQVFQIVTMEGWTALMVPLQQSVGVWIVVYFYPIIFIGAFFLLNLTLAVIKAKFTEEMQNKKEAAAPKKKKVDDAASSSEDEDIKAGKLRDQIQDIQEGKNMSPRSKENLINKIKIEHLLWRTDQAFDRRDAEHKIVERVDINEDEAELIKKAKKLPPKQKSKMNLNNSTAKQKVLSAVDKLSILRPAIKAFSFAQSATSSKIKVHPQINYSDVFYNKGEEKSLGMGRGNGMRIKQAFGSTLHKKNNKIPEGPIKEDDEEQQDQAGLLEGDEVRDQKRKQNRVIFEKNGNVMSQTMPPTEKDQKEQGVNNWLGETFAVPKHDDENSGKMKPLVFAGMNTHKRAGQTTYRGPASNSPQKQRRQNPAESKEAVDQMKKAVYESITKNFDVFEFLDKDQNASTLKDLKSPRAHSGVEQDLSDELEFELDDQDVFLDSDQVFSGQNQDRRNQEDRAHGENPLLDDLEDDLSNASSGLPQQILKRGSTQTTVEGTKIGRGANSSMRGDSRYKSPFNSSIIKNNQSAVFDERARSQRVDELKRKTHQPEVVYGGRQKGIMQLFRNCKKMTAKNQSFKEEYFLIRKKARSQEREHLEKLNKKEEEKRLFIQLEQQMKEKLSKITDVGKKSVRAKSTETKKVKLLEESIRFKIRLDIMKERRAQFFAPAVKKLDIVRQEVEKQYEEYVFAKRKIKVNSDMIDEPKLRKTILYRPASTDPILRQSEYLNRDPLIIKKKGYHHYDVENLMKTKDEKGVVDLELESARSEVLDRQYKLAVEDFHRKEVEIKKHREHQFVPNMEQIMFDKKLKIVVKMTTMKFNSVNDVFEKSGPGRFMTDREMKKLAAEEKKKQALKLKLPVRVPTKEMILGYQKKLFITDKQFHEELLRNEFYPSDEDQAGLLNRIEDEYNNEHRSHIFVTGTMSVCVAKPHADNKILNLSYWGNLKKIEEEKNAEAKGEEKVIKVEQLSPISPRKSMRGISGSETPIQSQGKDGDRLNHPSMFRSLKVSMNVSGVNNHSGSSNSMMKANNTSKYIFSQRKPLVSMAESLESQPGKPGPKPEIFTDKQIVKRLNQEVKGSKLFQAFNIKKYPNEIVRRIEMDANLFKKRRKKNAEKKKEEVAIVHQESDDSQEEVREAKRTRKIDYFVDRKFEGYYHISKARDIAFQRPKDTIEWSGQDVAVRLDPYKARLAIGRINGTRVWPYSIHGLLKMLRVQLRQFMNGPLVEHGMTCCVLGNTAVMCLDYYGASESLLAGCDQANTIFTLIFATEMGLRIVAVGPYKYQADRMNYMDGTIVMFSLIELIFMSGSGALSALRAVRIFRVFRVLRVARLLRGLKSMLQIINVISRSISSFIYLAMLLMLFIFIYALLGMQMFGGTFTDPEVVGTVLYNFDGFNNAFITSFILLTTENWNTVMFYAFSGTASQAIIAVYFVSCVFVGNWMLLNLFLAILLDSFTQVEEEDMMTDEKKERIKASMLEDLKIKEGEDFIEGMDELCKEGFVLKSDKPKKKKNKSSGKKTPESKPKPQGNILKESMEIDLQELQKRDEEARAERKKPFRGIECNRSCYLLTKENIIRRGAWAIINHGKFETLIMIVIVLSSLKLVFDTYTNNLKNDDPVIIYSAYIDLVFQIFFTLEMLNKIIACGFIMDENSYFTEAWNKLDGFIVVSGLIDTFAAGVDIPVVKVLRLLRILRPLRFVSHSSSMKTLIEALLASLGSIFNVGVVIIVVFLMFAILGVNLYAGKLQSCSVTPYLVNTQEECFKVRGEWTTFKQNMDNAITGMLTLFIVSNNEGWPDVMYAFGDATGVETGPKPGASIGNCYFFVGFVFVGSFFFLNLFVGVLFLSFEKAQRDEKESMLLDGDEIKWVDMMKMICDEQPEIIKIPKNFIRQKCFYFVEDDAPFANFIMTCIILNIFTMAATFEGQSEAYSKILEKINYFFTAAFAIECGTKLIAHGGHYFNSGWNKFDFFVVSASFLDIVMANMSANSLKVIRVGPQLARIMRVMRVTRLFKLLNKYKGLQALLQTITFSMPSVINAFALLALVYFIFSVLGVFFFKDITQGDQIDDYMNFTTFSYSLVMMLRLSTGEDWPIVMFDCMNTDADCIPGVNCGTIWAFVFYILFVVIQQYIMVNLFILIILQQFDLYYLPNDNVLDRFKDDVTKFKFVWRVQSKEFEGYKIRGTEIQKFFMDLQGDLGMSKMKNDRRGVERELVIMNIQADPDGMVYFNELLYKTMKRRYMPNRTTKKILFECELDTLDKLEKIMTAQIKLSLAKERKNAIAVNPFMSMMYKNMSFNVWNDIYHNNLPKRLEHIKLQLEREISEEEEEDEEEKEKWEYETEQEEDVDEADPGYQNMLDQQHKAEANMLLKNRSRPAHLTANINSPFGSINNAEDNIGGGANRNRVVAINENSPLFQFEDAESSRQVGGDSTFKQINHAQVQNQDKKNI